MDSLYNWGLREVLFNVFAWYFCFCFTVHVQWRSKTSKYNTYITKTKCVVYELVFCLFVCLFVLFVCLLFSLNFYACLMYALSIVLLLQASCIKSSALVQWLISSLFTKWQKHILYTRDLATKQLVIYFRFFSFFTV